MGTEKVNIGDITIFNQTIGLAKEADIPILDEVNWDGIIGLGFP
jgi:hypothetical protein